MPNPLYQQLGPSQNSQLIQRLEQFRQTFSGNPQQMIQSMLNSGRINQAQLNQYAQQANEIYRALGKPQK